MRTYETMVVLSTAGTETGDLIDRFVAVIEREAGVIDARHDWGVRRLSFEIQRQTQGHYWLLEYSAGPAVVKELERNIRIAEGVLCYLSLQQPHTGLPEPRAERTDDYGGDGHRDRDVPFHRLPARDPKTSKDDGSGQAATERSTPKAAAKADDGVTNQAKPVEEDQAKPVEKDEAKPAESDQASPGSATPGESAGTPGVKNDD